MANQERIKQQHARIEARAHPGRARRILAAAGIRPSLGRHGSESPQPDVPSGSPGAYNPVSMSASLESQAVFSGDSEFTE